MNYIEFEIGGKKRGFSLGLGLGQLMVKNPFSVTPSILYYGHKHDCIRLKKPIDFELWNIEDWVEDMPNTLNNENIEKLMLILIESIKKHLPKDEEDKGSKKK